MTRLLVLAIAYLLGAIPFGYLLVKWKTGADVRTALLHTTTHVAVGNLTAAATLAVAFYAAMFADFQAIAELGSGPLPADVTMRETGEWPRAIIGTPFHVRDTLVDIASVLHLDEVMLVTVVHDHQARLRSHELLANAFNLKPR